MTMVETRVGTGRASLVPIAGHRGLTGFPVFLEFADSKEWKEEVSQLLTKVIENNPKSGERFYNQKNATTPEERAISWKAFPKKLDEHDNKWAKADERSA